MTVPYSWWTDATAILHHQIHTTRVGCCCPSLEVGCGGVPATPG